MGYAAEKLNEDELGTGPVAPVVPLRARTGAVERAILAFPAALLPDLPVPVALDLESPLGRRFLVIMDEALADQRRGAGLLVLGPLDWGKLVVGVESERLRSADVMALLSARASAPLTDRDVLGDARPDEPRGLSVGQVLSRLRILVRSARPLEELERAA